MPLHSHLLPFVPKSAPTPGIAVVQSREKVLALNKISADQMDNLLRQFRDDVVCVQASELLALAAQQSDDSPQNTGPVPNSSPGVPSSSTAM
jgi:hypothetical protein